MVILEAGIHHTTMKMTIVATTDMTSIWTTITSGADGHHTIKTSMDTIGTVDGAAIAKCEGTTSFSIRALLVSDTPPRANYYAAIANSQISDPRMGIQIHPMLTLGGSYPRYFQQPRRFEEFAYMDPYELDDIMREYDIGSGRRRYYRGLLTDRYDDDDLLYSIKPRNRRDYVAILEFLGAHQLVQRLRYS